MPCDGVWRRRIEANMNWSATGAVLLALAVILGAFGAHGLQNRLDDYSRGVYEKAVFYHFLHAIGILVVAVLSRTGTFPQQAADMVCWCLLAGIVLFSGSLYALAVTGNRALGIVTPFGGLAFIAGWLLLAWRLRRII
jgi:uncharacterized membrane protein YgdD (TMEM256/DUF423 family)